MQKLLGVCIIITIFGCASKRTLRLPMIELNSSRTLLMANEPILFLGCFGNQAKAFDNPKDRKILLKWLSKRPLYKDISDTELNRSHLPTTNEIRKMCEENQTHRILILYSISYTQPIIYRFETDYSRLEKIPLGIVPRLEDGEDLELILGVLDQFVQPAIQIVQQSGIRLTAVLSKYSSEERAIRFAVFTQITNIQKGFTNFATAISYPTPKVVHMINQEKDIFSYKGSWVFPLLRSKRFTTLLKKHRVRMNSLWAWDNTMYRAATYWGIKDEKTRKAEGDIIGRTPPHLKRDKW